jgi:ADP-ribose pyrophosphatase
VALTWLGPALLADDGVRAVVLGRAVAARLAPDGVVLEGLSAPEAERLAFFVAAVAGFAGEVTAEAWRATAGDVMDLWGQAQPEVVAARLGPMLVRGASRARAGAAGPTTLRHRAGAGDVVVATRRLPYARFFAVEEYDVSWRRFDGAMSETVTRAAFLSGDAVTVLPYDPVRDVVLVVEQFRAGPHARGDRQCWQIEAIAGRIDPGESPEAAARREAVEEAGLMLADLVEVARYYPSPGAVSEYLYSYVALTDLPEGSAGVFGVEGETEDIRGHRIGFDRLMDLVVTGEIENAPLILTALWLQRERGRLRGL